jgi:hypothetical protein
VRKRGVFCPFLKSSPEERAVGACGNRAEEQQVDACQLLDEVATSAGRFGLGEIRREVKRAADECAT